MFAKLRQIFTCGHWKPDAGDSKRQTSPWRADNDDEEYYYGSDESFGNLSEIAVPSPAPTPESRGSQGISFNSNISPRQEVPHLGNN
ncbi:hypothetical protein N7461_000662 [Penicillium sp. DV-2018c]|nr:hypothetical protein N7461_000662 [Penicillium sp. DV-2018c]